MVEVWVRHTDDGLPHPLRLFGLQDLPLASGVYHYLSPCFDFLLLLAGQNQVEFLLVLHDVPDVRKQQAHSECYYLSIVGAQLVYGLLEALGFSEVEES